MPSGRALVRLTRKNRWIFSSTLPENESQEGC
jgi:hypothetical protein